MTLKVDKIFLSCVISTLVILQIKHGRHINKIYFNSSRQKDYGHSVPISDGYKSLEFKYEKALDELKLLRKDLGDLNTIRNNANSTASSGIKKGSKASTETRVGDDEIEFSACLIAKDENRNLPEWIAYHYTMVNLRHLVVCGDPFSESSPRKVLNRWKNVKGMKTELWAERTFFPPTPKTKLLKESRHQEITRLHHERQKACYEKCMRHLKKNDRSWTMLIDADEYLAFNPVSDNDDKKLYSKINKNEPNSSYRFINQLRKSKDDKEKRKAEQMKMRTKLPNGFNSNMSITDFIQKERNNVPWIDSSCLILPRLQFGNEEESNKAIIERGIPQGFQSKTLSTLKHFSHIKKGSTENGSGKCIVDVSKMERFKVKSPHAINNDCGRIGSADHSSSLLRVNHYTMSRQIFSKIQKNKKSISKETANQGESYEMQGWLHKFVNDIGSIDKAKELMTVSD